MDSTALLCNICHYFKLQVRSHQEQQAETLLDDYNQWYRANNLAKLLSDRMSSKDSRRRKSQGKYTVPDSVGHTERDDGYKAKPLQAYNSHNTIQNCIDPRLSDPFINSSSNTGYTRALTASPQDQEVERVSHKWERDDEDDSGEEKSPFTLAAPCWPNDFRPKEDRGIQPLSTPFIYDPFVDDNDNFEYSNGNEMDKERADEIARLKGVLWPGMDIFDSATEQMKRKRNQKKDESILKMMEKTSMGVEPTELVFSPTGILRKQRVISGNVEDSSPLKGETPIPKKRATRPKRVLSQVDPNAQRGLERKRPRKTIKQDCDGSVGGVYQHDLYTPQRALVQVAGRLGGQMPAGNDMDEFALALGDHDFQQHSKFAIFRDMSVSQDSKVENQGRFLHGVTAPSQPFLLRGDIATHNDSHSPHLAAHSPGLLEKGSRTIMDKENIEPMLNVYGRVDPLVGWQSPAMKRSDRALSPQYLFGDVQYSGYSPFECHESPMGYCFNPLSSSLTRMATEENPIYAAEPENMLKGPSAARVSSPDATISDVEDEDFNRLYLDGSS